MDYSLSFEATLCFVAVALKILCGPVNTGRIISHERMLAPDGGVTVLRGLAL